METPANLEPATPLPSAEALPPPVPSAQPMFFPVSGVKLVVMSIVTFGLYEFYWFYKNWKFIRMWAEITPDIQQWNPESKRHIMPFWRAMFGYFFCFSLFKEVEQTAAWHDMKCSYSPGLLTLVWIGLSLCWKLPVPYYVISFLACVALLPVQKVINEINAKITPDHKPNRRFTAWNIVGIVLGGLCWVLGTMG